MTFPTNAVMPLASSLGDGKDVHMQTARHSGKIPTNDMGYTPTVMPLASSLVDEMGARM